MKKLLSFLLSTTMVATSFAATLPALAKGSDGVFTPDVYDGSMPEELENVFGFEGATLTDDNNESKTYINSWYSWASPEPGHVSIDSTEAASGKSSLKANLDNTRSWETRNFINAVAAFDKSSIKLEANTKYTIKAKVKATDDFDGQVYIRLLTDTGYAYQNAAFNEYYTTETAILNKTPVVKEGDKEYSYLLSAEKYSELNKNDSLDLSNWTEVIATNLHENQRYTADILAEWLSKESPGIAVYVQATRGTIWIDDIDLVPVDEYNGILTRENQVTADNNSGDGSYKITSDGGFETGMTWWMSQAGFGGSDGENKLSQTKAVSHSGSAAAKVEMISETTKSACMGFYLNLESEDGKRLVESENGVYVEAWVKLDDFNGKIYSKISNAAREFGRFCWTDYYTTEHYMLGGKDGKTVSAEDIGNGWVKIRSSVISAGKFKSWVNNGADSGVTPYTSLLLDLWCQGSGTLYVDDVTIKPVEDNTVTYSVNHQDDSIAFTSINLKTVDECDIYYTLDGTDPRYSKTAMLYDDAYTVVVGSGYNRIQAAALDKETGLFGEVVPTNIFGKTDAFNVTLNAGEETKAAYAEVVMQHADHMERVDVSFNLNAEGINGKVAAKMFLAGYGMHKLTVGENTYTGGWVNTDCKIAEISKDGTVKATATLDNMDKGYSRLIMVLDGEATEGTVTITDVKVDVTPYAKPVVKTAEIDTPVNNFYTAGSADYDSDLKTLDKSFALTNNTAYYQGGTVGYKVTDPYGKVICDEEFEVEIDAYDTFEDYFTVEGVEKYGVYTVEYTYTDVLGRERTSGSSVFAFVKDNSANTASSTLGISSHMTGYAADYDFDSLLESYKTMGVKFVRIDAYWNEIENEAGVYSFSEALDNSVEAIKAAGLTPVIIINAYGYHLYENDTTAVPAFTEFAKAVVNRYGAGYYEVINEPNLALELGSDYMREPLYAEVLRSVYTAISPLGATVIAGNVSHQGGGFLEGMIEADSGILDCMDIWAVHPYSFNLGSDSSYESTEIYHTYFAELKEKYLDDKNIELWAGEFGYPVCNTQYGVTDEEAAYYTVRAIAGLAKDGITENHTIYTDSGSSYNYYQETNFGIFNSENKRTAAALNNYVNTLSGYTFNKALANGENDVYAYEYASTDKANKYMLWSVNGEKEYTVNVPYGRVSVVDIYGNHVDCEVSENGTGYDVKLSLDEKPVYVMYNPDPVSNPREYENVVNGDFESETVPTLNGNGIGATVSLDTNTVWDGNQSFRLDIPENASGTANFKLASVDLSEYDANIRYQIRFRLKASAAEQGTVKVQMDSYFGGNKFASYQGDWRYFGEMMTREVGTESYVLNDRELKSEWTAYETVPFTLIGNKLDMQFVLSSKGATLWIDNIEIVPAEDNSNNHGKLYTSYDKETDMLYVTAKADEGYELDKIKLAFNGNNYTESKTADYTVSARDNVTTVVYKMASEQFRGNMLTFTHEACKYFNATFKKAEVTLAGDSTDDGSTDLLDLVRTKKYLAKLTFDLDLVNADYDSNGIVDATDLASLKKDLLK